MIWPKEVTMVSRTQPSGPLCLWQCLHRLFGGVDSWCVFGPKGRLWRIIHRSQTWNSPKARKEDRFLQFASIHNRSSRFVFSLRSRFLLFKNCCFPACQILTNLNIFVNFGYVALHRDKFEEYWKDSYDETSLAEESIRPVKESSSGDSESPKSEIEICHLKLKA